MISSRDLRFLEIASQLAYENKNHINQHGAVLAMGNKLISRGINNHRTQMSNFKYGHLECHAELDVIMKAKQCILRG